MCTSWAAKSPEAMRETHCPPPPPPPPHIHTHPDRRYHGTGTHQPSTPPGTFTPPPPPEYCWVPPNSPAGPRSTSRAPRGQGREVDSNKSTPRILTVGKLKTLPPNPLTCKAPQHQQGTTGAGERGGGPGCRAVHCQRLGSKQPATRVEAAGAGGCGGWGSWSSSSCSGRGGCHSWREDLHRSLYCACCLLCHRCFTCCRCCKRHILL